MNYCQSCFALVRRDVGLCPRCASVMEFTAPGPEDQGRIDGRAGRWQPAREPVLSIALRLTRTALAVGIGLAVGIAGFGVLIEQNRAAQAKSFVQSQLGEQRIFRSEELQHALIALQDLHTQLRAEGRRAGITSDERLKWSNAWEKQLSEVRMRYKLDGQSSLERSSIDAELALRNATLYLTSLERKILDGASEEEYGGLERSLLRCFDEAKSSIERGF